VSVSDGAMGTIVEAPDVNRPPAPADESVGKPRACGQSIKQEEHVFFTPDPTSSPVSNRILSTKRRSPGRALASLALTAALTAPLSALAGETVNGVAPVSLAGDVAVASLVSSLQPQASSDDLLRRGADQLNRKQYEEALATLQQVDAKSWNEKDRQTLNDLIARAKNGAEQRQAARTEFEQGEAALAANNPAQAVAHYRNAADNKFADEGTRAKAHEQLSVATDAQRKALGDMRSIYNSAEADYKAGNYPEAQAKFLQLEAAGFSAPLFHKSPSDYLKDISKKTVAAPAAAAAPTEAAAATTEGAAANTDAGATSPPEPVELTKQEIANAYKIGRDQYRKGDWIMARKNLTVARDAGYDPGLFNDKPAKILARMDAKEQADAAKAQKQAESQAAEVAAAPPAPAAETAAAAGAGAAAGAAVASNNDQAAAQPAPQPNAAPAAAEPAATESANAATPSTAPSGTALQQTAEMDRIQAAQNAAKARDLVTQADALASSNPEQALTLYAQAAQLDPANQQAVAGRNAMQERTGRGAAPGTLMDRTQQAIETQRQAIEYSLTNALTDADAAITANNFIDAQRGVDRARVARNSNPNIFTPQEISQFDTRIETAQNRLDQARAHFAETDSKRQAEEAARAIQSRQAEIDKARRETVAGLIAQSRRLTDAGKYSQALGVVDQILVIDPGNDYAIGVRPLIEDRALFQEQRKYREAFDRNLSKQLNMAEEMRIPYSDILIYPENWPDLSETRDRSTAEERGEVKEDAQVQAQLEKRLPELRFDQVAFSDVVDFLRDVTGANLFVNWRALEGAGIDKNAPVTARLRDVKFSKALTTILEDVGGGTVKLAYTIDEGVITISTEEDLSKNVVTRVFDIRDLIINIPDFDQAPDFNITQSNTGGGRGGGGGGGSLFGGGGNQNDQQGPTRQELVDSIIKLIQDTVASESWKDNGGTVGSLRELSGQLIVTQTPENQHQLVKLLEQLRETRAIQVTIEARFLKVQRNFLEDVGVDFDFQFNNVSSKINGGGPIRFQQNSADFTAPAQLDTTLPGNLATVLAGSSLSTSISYIDDFQVNALIRATQAEQSSSIITAPRVTLFNGQRAYVLVATTRAYVSDLQPVVGANAVGFDPTISTVQSGVLLDVQATVSSDRKYVTLTLRPQLSNLLALVPFSIGGTTIIPDNNSSTQPFSGQGFIQQPEVQITEVRTTVSVPDGGTLLLGGQTLSGELEREAGVPVLSKIPFLKRLFTNRSSSHDDQILLILVKPTIIIQREQEAKQFPLLKNKTS
jgi:general secretion pathway protein D